MICSREKQRNARHPYQRSPVRSNINAIDDLAQFFTVNVWISHPPVADQKYSRKDSSCFSQYHITLDRINIFYVLPGPFLRIFPCGHFNRVIIIKIRILISRRIIFDPLFIHLQIFINPEFPVFLNFPAVPVHTPDRLLFRRSKHFFSPCVKNPSKHYLLL